MAATSRPPLLWPFSIPSRYAGAFCVSPETIRCLQKMKCVILLGYSKQEMRVSAGTVCIRRKLGSERFRVGQTKMKNPRIQVHVREETEGRNITVRVWMGYVSVTYGDTRMDGGQEETCKVRELFDISLVVISSRCLAQHYYRTSSSGTLKIGGFYCIEIRPCPIN